MCLIGAAGAIRRDAIGVAATATATAVRQTLLAAWIVGEPIAGLLGVAVGAACAARAGSTTLPKRTTREDDEQRRKPNQRPHQDQGAGCAGV